jgi:hypothetical protein
MLVHSSLLDETVRTLSDLGYRQAGTDRWFTRPSHHLPPLIHRETGLGIELHREICSTSMGGALDTSRMFARATERKWLGKRLKVLGGTDRVLHHIVHSQIHHAHHEQGRTELRHLLDLALLAARCSSEIDWDEVSHSFVANDHAAVLENQAAQCAALLGCPLPVSYGDPYASLARLRSTLMTGQLKRVNARLVISRYWRSFMDHPQLAINLLNPKWWPGRIRSVMFKLRSGQL